MASTATNEDQTAGSGGDAAGAAAGGKGQGSALSRKLFAAKAGPATTDRTALRALRLGVARTADDLFDLPVAAIGATQDRCMIDDLRRHFNDKWLLMLLEGPDGRFGVASVDPETVMVLIQSQTMGTVFGGTPPDRPFTDTDAALAEPLIDGMLQRASELAEVEHARRCLTGNRFGARAEDVQDLVLELEDDRYRIFELRLDIAHGKVQSVLRLALPDLTEEESDSVANGPRGPHLDQATGVIRAELTAVLGRIRMPLSTFSRLKPGTMLELTSGELGKTELRSIEGVKVAIGRLGQTGGLRALRVNEPDVAPPSPAELAASFEPAGGGPSPLDAMGGFGGGMGAMDGMDMGGFDAGDGAMAGGFDDLPDLPAMDFDPGGGMDLPDIDADPDMTAWSGDAEAEGLPDLPDLPPLGGGGDDGGLPDLPMGTPMDLNLGDPEET